MQEYTVVGFYENNGQIFSHLVSARNSQHAFFVVAKEHPTATFVSAIKGRVVEGQGIEFAGDSLVDADTVVSQPEVFNRDEIELHFYLALALLLFRSSGTSGFWGSAKQACLAYQIETD